MKKFCIWTTCLAMGFLTACNEAKTTETAAVATDSVAVAPALPMADSEQTARNTLTVGSHRYSIVVERHPDDSLPLVVDELDQKFYDNCVTIKISRDDAEWFSRKVTKADFADFLSDAEKKGCMLLGMHCDTARCDKANLCFTAQVGMAGEGPAFLYLIPTGGGAPSVQRDNQQEEINYEKKDAESL